MSRFNESTQGRSKTTNLAGGAAYKMTPEMELVNLLLTSFVKDGYYESSSQQVQRLKSLLTQVDPLFAAKAAIYARDTFNMRSVTHVTAGELSTLASGKDWAKRFYDKVIVRPDDMLEIVGYISNGKDVKLPSAMKKGFAQAFERFDGHQLAKNRAEGKAISLVDIVNMVHPDGSKKLTEVSTELYKDVLYSLYGNTKSKARKEKYKTKYEELEGVEYKTVKIPAVEALVLGILKAENTWESKVSKAGQGAKSATEKEAAKKEAWSEMLKSGKMGYMALVKNIRNILQSAPEMVDELCKQLTIPTKVKKSRLLPFRFLSAIKELEKVSLPSMRDVLVALNEAVDISCSNVPELPGNVLIVVDDSGSMTWTNVAGTQVTCAEMGGLFASVLYKAHKKADLMTFASRARYHQLNPMDSVLTLARSMNFNGGGTNFSSLFQTANKRYDSIVIISDQEGWMRGGAPNSAYASYKARYNAQPNIFCFNLANSGSMMFPEQSVYVTAGFSEKALEVMGMLGQDRRALVNEVNKVDI